MIYTPEEVTAARAWIANPKRTGAKARIALQAMGFASPYNARAAEQVGRADYWAKRMVGYAALAEAIERAGDVEEGSDLEYTPTPGPAVLYLHVATITIAQDGVWAGTGVLRNGVISECGACLGASYGADKNDDVEGAYRAIEQAIALGRNSAEHDGCVYTWDIDVVEAGTSPAPWPLGQSDKGGAA
jgi:hypothetical protein